MKTEKLTAKEEDRGKRLDLFLSENFPDITRSRLKKIIESGEAKVNGEAVKPGRQMRTGETVEIVFEEPKEYSFEPVDYPIEIVYEDESLAVVNKPQGITVHHGNGTGSLTLVNILLGKLDSLSGIGGILRPGIVHRIDKNTSGLLVVAKDDFTHANLSAQIAEKSCERRYIALLEGVVKEDSGRIETFLERSKSDRTKIAVSRKGRAAATNFKVLERFAGYTLCEFKLETGRTHQIRVHAKHMGHPVVGDKEYGFAKQKFRLKGQLLHAYSLSFTHPKDQKRLEFQAPLPEYFENVLKKLK